MRQGGTLKTKIYNSVLNDILQGNYTSESIISEKMLVEKYNISKSPVRDALIELCNEGILRSIPRYGYELIQVTQKDIENILQYRVILETECLHNSIKSMSDKDIEEFEQYMMKHCMVPTEIDIWKHWGNNMRFHLRLNSYAQNKYIYDKLEESMNTLTRAYAQSYWNRWHKIEYTLGVDSHLKILECIKERDTNLAVKMLKEDIWDYVIG